jgi:hypothetical protein
MATLWEHYQEGGWAMWIILFWLILAIAIIAERSVYLYKSLDQQGRVPLDDAEVHLGGRHRPRDQALLRGQCAPGPHRQGGSHARQPPGRRGPGRDGRGGPP